MMKNPRKSTRQRAVPIMAISAHGLSMIADRQVRAALIAAAMGLSQAAPAAVIYNNGAPNLVSGTQMSEFLVAENFILGAAATIANIRFWSIQSAVADYSGSVYWAIYSNAAGSPGAVLFGNATLATTATATGLSTGFGYPEFAFDIDVPDFALTPGSYWLGLHNGALASTTPTEMLWETTTTQIGPFGQYRDAGTWIDSGNEHAFRLESAAVTPPLPEPGSLALVALALAAAAGLTRRKVQ